jgi:hypothetical protein
MSTIAMPTPMYVLIADLPSLVIRPPFIRSRLTQLNQKPVASVTHFSQTKGDIYHGPPPSISPAEDAERADEEWGLIFTFSFAVVIR